MKIPAQHPKCHSTANTLEQLNQDSGTGTGSEHFVLKSAACGSEKHLWLALLSTGTKDRRDCRNQSLPSTCAA